MSQKENKKMSDTPRTDDKSFNIETIAVNLPPIAHMFCHAAFAKELERELNAAKSDLSKYTEDSGDDSLYNVRRLRNELNAANAEIERLKCGLREERGEKPNADF